jgi:hypothetical protein
MQVLLLSGTRECGTASLSHVVGVERSANACLEFENGPKPKRPKQNIPRSEAVIKGARRRAEKFADGRYRYR